MNESQRIVLCGTSIFVAAIESALEAMAIGEVLAINHHLPDALVRINTLAPSLVIMDKAGYDEYLAGDLLDQCIPVIILDESQRKITAVSGQCLADALYLEAGMTELTQTIEQILSANRTTFIERNHRMGAVDKRPPSDTTIMPHPNIQ
jgi:hypothetical protein